MGIGFELGCPCGPWPSTQGAHPVSTPMRCGHESTASASASARCMLRSRNVARGRATGIQTTAMRPIWYLARRYPVQGR